MKHIIKVEVLENLPATRPLIAMDANMEFFVLQKAPMPPNNEIWYTSSDGNIVTPYQTSSLPTIVSNTYSNGKGVIRFASDVTSIGDSAFAICKSLTSITIPNSVISIGENAFESCHSLASIIIPNSVTSIEKWAFCYCISLTSIIIPNSVTSVGYAAFTDCSALTSVIIGNGVTKIEGDAFYNCISLTSITIPNGVIRIGSAFQGSVFYGCSSLTSVSIAISIKTIGKQSFYNCKSLIDISYEGTIEQWNTIGKGSNWNYNVPATVVHCTDGDVEI